MMPQIPMCRESRKILEDLDNTANMYNAQGLITPGHVYICDRLVLKFYTQPIMNILHSHIKAVPQGKKSNYEYYTIKHWERMIINLLSGNNNASRSTVDVGSDGVDGFITMNSFLIADYGISDAELLNKLVNTYTNDEIRDACAKARQSNVYEIRYVNAILDKARAYQQVKANDIDQMADKIMQSESLANKSVVRHTPLDIAVAQYEWQRKVEDNELDRKFREMFGDE